MSYFHFPYFYPQYFNRYNKNRYMYNDYEHDSFKKNSTKITHSFNDIPAIEDKIKPNNSKNHDDNYFFELFGLKLYFDDILLICLIFFLYEEGVKDDELFISLILLLLS